jgi:hypothetical protein
MCKIDRITAFSDAILEERGGRREHPTCDRVCLLRIP